MIRQLIPSAPVVLAVCLAGVGNLHAQTPIAPAPGITSPQQMMAETDAEAAARTWLKLLDSGQYAETWQTASPLFHTAITQDGWIALLKGGVPVFGKVTSRKLKEATFSRILPGAPDGQYVVIQYQTTFANMKEATEQMAMVSEAGTWKVCGYHIK
jgi:hypothetical protein